MRPGLIVATIATMAVAALAAAQAPAGPHQLAGGGEVTVRRQGGDLLITVTGPRAGLASLCVGDDQRVRILHASAAVGEAIYERWGTTWALKSKFDFKLRETRAGSPPEEERSAYFSAMGWVANASRAGNPKREFRIRLTAAIQFLGVTFLSTNEPMAVSYWPASMNDDCRAVQVAQGNLPATAEFRPGTWHRLE